MNAKLQQVTKQSASLAQRVRRPLQEFAEAEASGGIVLLLCIVAALLWANSPFASSYTGFWDTKLGLSFGSFELSKSLLHWIDDGLMAIFFFYIGLEIKREVLVGELSSPRQAVLPLVAALGGMLVPAAIYTIFNFGKPGASGWGIPMATDIAFSLGVLALLSRYASLSVKVFLIALAIVDDIGAVLVIALFYSTSIQGMWLLLAAAFLLALILINWAGVRQSLIYVLLGIGLWYAVLQSGVHATIAGVLLAATIPSRATLRTDDFMTRVRELLHELERMASTDKYRTAMSKEKQETMKALEATQKEAEGPLYRMEHALQPWIAFAVMPLFALANAGVTLDLGLLTSIVQPVGLGIVLGLVLGKQLGVFLATWLAVKMGLAALPEGFTWRQVYGVGWLAGIGFTMSLFIATLAFQDAQLLLTAKESILLASLLAGLGSWIIFRLVVSAQGTESVSRKEPKIE